MKVASLFSTTFTRPSVPHQMITMLRGPPDRHQCSQAELMCASASSGGHLLPSSNPTLPMRNIAARNREKQAKLRFSPMRDPLNKFMRPLDLSSSTRYTIALLLPVPSTVLQPLREQQAKRIPTRSAPHGRLYCVRVSPRHEINVMDGQVRYNQVVNFDIGDMKFGTWS